ncbi:hypothetical protein C8R45DRAFT_1183646 [Mycena sanguinolenta]|nr:hypothetical protein C8R45DRAFT_1183646 [Mycena sanguinolenta]
MAPHSKRSTPNSWDNIKDGFRKVRQKLSPAPSPQPPQSTTGSTPVLPSGAGIASKYADNQENSVRGDTAKSNPFWPSDAASASKQADNRGDSLEGGDAAKTVPTPNLESTGIAKRDQKGGSLPQNAEKTGRGGTGGIGEGPRFLTLPVAATLGRKIEIPSMSLSEFCKEYKLDQHIFDLLDKAEFENVRGLIQEKDLGKKEYGLRLGEVAEVKWALKARLLICPGIENVRIPPGLYKPTLIGGIGGAGGEGDIQGGDGGLGRGPTLSFEDLLRFGRFRGGIGGEGGASYGGASGRKSGNDGESEKGPNVEKGPSPQKADNDERVVEGGAGGKGGWGRWWGGEGGVGEGPIIPLEAVGEFKWIQGKLSSSMLIDSATQTGFFPGGRGGEGGASPEIGGTGGVGEAPIFPKPLTYIDDATRLQIHTQNMNLKLRAGENSEVNQKFHNFKLDIGDRLLNRLHDHGFRTVGALFEIHEAELVDPFKPANVYTLVGVLEQFLSKVKRSS